MVSRNWLTHEKAFAKRKLMKSECDRCVCVCVWRWKVERVSDEPGKQLYFLSFSV